MNTRTYVDPMTMEEKEVYNEINRLLKRKRQDLKLRKSRGILTVSNVGRFYIIDTYTNSLVEHFVDIQYYLRKLHKNVNQVSR